MVIIMTSGDSKKEPVNVNFKTVNSEKHVSFVSNRIWGGMQAGGLFELNFILEHKPLPDKITMRVDPNNGTEKELSRSQSNEVIRENQATVYLSLETLVALSNWLNAVVQDLQVNKVVEIAPVVQDLQTSEAVEIEE